MDPDFSSSYISHFRVHLAHVQAHLAGETGDVLPPSFVTSTGCWSSSEKSAFFHALSRYSRLRPDLIAAHIKTKSIVDVRAYIERLETVSKANPISWTRKDIDIAFEVSDSWVELEERNASSITAAELLWDDEQCRSSRQAEIAERRADTPDLFDNWRQRAEVQWNREDTLKRLDASQLNVLESFLRESDFLFSVEGTQVDQTSNPSQEARLDPGSTVTGIMHNANINRLSHSISPPLLNAPEQFASEPRGDNMQSAAQTPVQTADQTSQQVLSSTAPRDGLTPDGLASQVAPGVLNPVARRRLSKLLYARRRRAGQVNLAVSKLQSGQDESTRNPGPKKSTTKEDREETAGPHAEEVLEQESTKLYSKGGMTKNCRIRQQFAEQQIDFGELQQTGLDLFRLSMLRRLIELYKSGYEQAGAHIVTSISADTIRLLRSITIDFMTEVIYRAIVFKNQELLRKGEIKTWHGKKQISPDVIRSCLGMMGLGNLTKEEYFERLLDQSDTDAMSENKAEEFEATDHGHVNESTDQRPMSDQYLPFSILTAPDTTFLSTIEEYRDNTAIMQVDTDEKSLQRELEEEEELSHLDEVLIQQNEVELWKEVAQ